MLVVSRVSRVQTSARLNFYSPLMSISWGVRWPEIDEVSGQRGE